MAKTRSMTRNQNHDHGHEASSSSSKKRLDTFDKDDVAPWSDLNDDVLYLVMTQLGVVDFLTFSGVCKSWRSLALSNKNRFMASKPPMALHGKMTSAGRICSGVACGYLILMGMETHNFWLVNPITRHQLHCPDLHLLAGAHDVCIRAILVFSPSISGWVFVVLHRRFSRSTWGKANLSFYIDGKKGWNHVSSTIPITDLHFFKGKIYTLHTDCSLGELRLCLNRKLKWMLLKTKNFLNPDFLYPELVSSGENLYVIRCYYSDPKKLMELDIGEMKWVLPEKTIQEYAFFISSGDKSSAAMKVESWDGPQTQFLGYAHFVEDDKSRKCMFFYKWLWYFPHDCLTVNILDE